MVDFGQKFVNRVLDWRLNSIVSVVANKIFFTVFAFFDSGDGDFMAADYVI